MGNAAGARTGLHADCRGILINKTKTMNRENYTPTREFSPTTKRVLDVALAVAIGLSLAVLLVYGL